MERSRKKLIFYNNLISLKQKKLKYLKRRAILYKIFNLNLLYVNGLLKMVAVETEIEAHTKFIQIFEERVKEGESIMKHSQEEDKKDGITGEKEKNGKDGNLQVL